MVAKVYYDSDGVILRIEFINLVGKIVRSVGDIPTLLMDTLDIKMVDIRDLKELINILAL